MTDFVTELPDLPRWVEVRGMLLAGRGRTLGIGTEPRLNGVVHQPDTRLAAVIGEPEPGLIWGAARTSSEILAVPENSVWVGEALPDWTSETATLHVLPDFNHLPEVPVGSVRPLEPDELATIPDLPAALRSELETELSAGSPVAAALDDGRPVAFCYAGSVTETLWDVSIETLEPYRRQGHAARCATWLIHHLAWDDKRPVWGASASNAASARLAAKLGFTAADSLVVFSPS